MQRRQFIEAAGAVGLAGLSGYTNRQQDTYLSQAQQLGLSENWQQRRIGAASNWTAQQRQGVPNREQDTTWTNSESFQTAPWEPPEGWQDTAAGNVDSIQILNHGAANMEFDPATLATHELFEEKTGITVDVLEIGVDQANLREQQFLSSQQSSPHVMNVDGPLTPVFVQQGYLEAVDPLYTEEMWDSYIPALRSLVEWDIDPNRQGTHQYGFPNIAEATVGSLRTDLVQEQGIDPARFDGEWSWDLLEEMMAAFEDTDVFGFAYYAGTPVYLFYSFRQLLYQQGGRMVQDDGTVQIDTPPARTVLRKMAEWRDNGWVPQEVISYGEGDIIDLFLAGRVAYAEGFSDFVPRALAQYDANSQYRAVVPAAANTGPNPTQASLVAPNATAINPFADTGHKLAGLLYGDLRLSYPSQWWEFTFEGNMSFMDQVYGDAADQDAVPFSDVLGSAIDRGVLELFPQQQAIFQRLATTFQQAIVGDMTPQQATQQGQQFVDDVLGQ
ncbi:ABC transporter substrate-binding protein [Halorussus halophilus]|uniref:ABC transporter substrate-binding protein n=1 Tax=Halorussus halophilus TaxID=2650975 RepID=UPI0013018D87|nr:extracellular solute-binding protein [Halorussus halophilus]